MIGNFSLYELSFYFFAYAFLGWCTEVVFAAIKLGKFVNRGFLNGPLCPIYGAGVVCILLALTPLQKGRPWDFLAIFACSSFLCSALELITGYILEKFFHRKWWDYSDRRFNLKSYVCLEMTLVWGFACLLVVYVLQPVCAALLSPLPVKAGYGILISFGILFISDIVCTVLQITSLGKRFRELESINKKMRMGSDFIGEKLYHITAKSEARLAVLKEKIENSRLGKAFPKLIKENAEKDKEPEEQKENNQK